MTTRVKWIDVVKALGIFIVYLGHFGWQAGRGFTFVFTHNVALFFFISGCAESFSTEKNIIKYILKKIRGVLLPAYFFAFLAIFVIAVADNAEWWFIEGQIPFIMRGMIRNQFPAGTLWFLTCLFVMQIIFFIIKQLKNKWLIFFVSVFVYYVSVQVLPLYEIIPPKLCYNFDSALVYLIYYAIGYLTYPWIDALFKLDTWIKKMIFWVTGVFAMYYCIRFFFGVDLLSYFKFPDFAYIFTPILVTCIMIWAYVVFAKILEDIEGLAEIGKNTLYLCGSEYILKIFVSNFLSVFGFRIAIYDAVRPLSTYLYAAFLLVVANKYLVPVEKYILKKIIR